MLKLAPGLTADVVFYSLEPMKPIYALLFIIALMFGGYLVINGFSFDNISFSNTVWNIYDENYFPEWLGDGNLYNN